MRHGPAMVPVLAMAAFAASTGICRAQLRAFPEPEWRNDQYGYALHTPPGTILCIGPEGSPASHPVTMPIEPGVPCEDMGTLFEGQDRVVVEARYDTAEQYENVGQLVSEICEARAQTSLVTAATIAHAGKRLGGLETMICALDLGDGTFLKIAVARKEGPRTPPVDFLVTLQASVDRKAAAEAVWSDAIGSFHLIR